MSNKKLKERPSGKKAKESLLDRMSTGGMEYDNQTVAFPVTEPPSTKKPSEIIEDGLEKIKASNSDLRNGAKEQGIDELPELLEHSRKHISKIYEDILKRVADKGLLDVKEMTRNKFDKMMWGNIDKVYTVREAKALVQDILADVELLTGSLRSSFRNWDMEKEKSKRRKMTPEEKERWFRIIDKVCNGDSIYTATLEKTETTKSNFRKNRKKYKSEFITYIKSKNLPNEIKIISILFDKLK